MGSFQYYLQLIAINSCVNKDILRNHFGLQINISLLSCKLDYCLTQRANYQPVADEIT